MRRVFKCIECGNEKETFQKTTVWCSKECTRRWKAKNAYDKRMLRECKCAACGKLFLDTNRWKAKKYCSDECRKSKWFFRGTSLYIPIAFFHHKHVCNKCGIDNVFVLCVHHIDSNRKNNDPSNLEILCANCHILTHNKQSKTRLQMLEKIRVRKEEMNKN